MPPPPPFHQPNIVSVIKTAHVAVYIWFMQYFAPKSWRGDHLNCRRQTNNNTYHQEIGCELGGRIQWHLEDKVSGTYEWLTQTMGNVLMVGKKYRRFEINFPSMFFFAWDSYDASTTNINTCIPIQQILEKYGFRRLHSKLRDVSFSWLWL